MTDPRHAGTDPAASPEEREADTRSDLEQAVAARSDAVERGEGKNGDEPDSMTRPGAFAGTSGTGGDVKNQDMDAQ